MSGVDLEDMCGRFSITSDPLTRLLLEITNIDFPLEDQFNIAPTEPVHVITQNSEGVRYIKQMRWWLLPYWLPEPSVKYSMFNARSESLTKSRAFREPFQRRRCLIPASGYYEWQKENNQKLPLYITPNDADGFMFAGLWDRWRGDDGAEGKVIESCTIITTTAAPSIEYIHDRMPVHLDRAQIDAWLYSKTDSKTLLDMLVPRLSGALEIVPVSNYVNNSRNKDARCIQPIGEPSIVH